MNHNKDLLSGVVIIFSLTFCGGEDPKQAVDDGRFIPGLLPADIYQNYENEGFEIEKNLSGEYGNSWVCRKSTPSIEYEVRIFSSTVLNVESISATATLKDMSKDIEAVKHFFLYFATIPFEGAEPERAQKWIKESFNKDKASININNVRFELYAPSKFVRMVMVEAVKK